MRLSKIITGLCLIYACLFCSCGKKPSSAQLERIAEMISSSPSDALDSLKTIDYASLSESDRHYHDFLSIKAADKQYIRHTSDSLILDVIAYYGGTSLYPEALYYGARVYCDLGDAPTALEYFHSALDNVHPDSLELKGNILSQTSRLLDDLRLHSRAIPYVQQAITVDSLLKDTFNLVYDHVLLGQIYLRRGDYAYADNNFIHALSLNPNPSEQDAAYLQVLRAAVKLRQNEIDSALTLARGAPERIRPIQRNEAMIYASDIYLSAGIPDTAYHYANLIVHSNHSNNRKNGYRNLFSPELYSLIPPDSIPFYIRDYNSALETYYNRHESQQALMQDAFYNYQLHQRAREQAEHQSQKLTNALHASVIIALLLICALVLAAYRRKKNLSDYQAAVLELEQLRKSLENDTIIPSGASDRDLLRDKLRQELQMIQKQVSNRKNIPESITGSEVYTTIQGFLDSKKAVSDNSTIWSALENIVIASSPLFRERLTLLAGQALKPHDLHLVLLIKCGFTPSQTTLLLGRTKGTISYRRRHIGEIILGNKVNSELIDKIILCL